MSEKKVAHHYDSPQDRDSLPMCELRAEHMFTTILDSVARLKATDHSALTASLQLLARAEKAETELATLRALCVRQTDALKGASFLGYLCDEGGKAIPRDSVEYKDIHDGIQKALKLTPADLHDCVTVKREEWERLQKERDVLKDAQEQRRARLSGKFSIVDGKHVASK